MKKVLISMLVVLGMVGPEAFAGDGYAVSAGALVAILNSPEVTRMATPFYVDEVRLFGEASPNDIQYIIHLRRDDMGATPFCLWVKVKGLQDNKIESVSRWDLGSRICH